jgi:hypothetical protein
MLHTTVLRTASYPAKLPGPIAVRSTPASLAGESPAHLQRSMYGVWYLLHFPSLKIHIDWQAVEQASIRIEAS